MTNDLVEKLAILGKIFLGNDGMSAKTLGIFSCCVAHTFDLGIEDQMRIVSLMVVSMGDEFEDRKMGIGSMLGRLHHLEHGTATKERSFMHRCY